MNRIGQRIEDWKRRLIDLSRRNRLLFFSRTRGTTLEVVEPSPNDVFSRLVHEEKPWQFLIPPEKEPELEQEQILPVEQAILEKEGEAGVRENGTGLTWDQIKARRKPNELLADLREGSSLRKILRNLHRRSSSDFEERGVRILYLTFGILNWKEVQQSEIVKSPILMVPVELKRESINDPFRLSPVDEEIVLNPALEVKLTNDFKLQIPPLPEDWDEVASGDYLDSFESEIRKYGWNVEDECWLGLFSFHKLVIYHDLSNHGNLIGEHPVIRALCDEIEAPLSIDIPDPRELDNKLSPKDSYPVADADSSQLVCIETVKAGGNLVIQGPPGTGKSQTITNLVAEFVARGKSVLFVSEKMAALEVVFKRLANANLANFCLQLHSHRANKRDVIQELHKTYRQQLQPKKGLTEYELRQLVERLRKLNDYVHALHLVRQPLGRSAFEVLGEIAGFDEIPYVPAGQVEPDSLTPERLDEADQLARRLSSLWNVAVEGESFPWFGCSVPSYTIETRTEFQNLLQKCQDALANLRKGASEFSDKLGLEAPAKLSESEWLLKTGDLLLDCPGVPKSWLTGREVDPLIEEAHRFSTIAQEHRELRAVLESLYKAEFFQLANELSQQLKQAVDSFSACLGHPLANDPDFPLKRNLLCEWARDFEAHISEWESEGENLNQILGLQGELTPKRLRELLQLSYLCQSEDRPDASWFNPQKLREVDHRLQAISADYGKRNKNRRTVLSTYDPAFLDLDLDTLIENFAGSYASIWRWFRPGYHRTRREIRRLRLDGTFPGRVLSDLRFAREIRNEEKRLLREFHAVRDLLGGWFKGFDTNFDRVGKAVKVAWEIIDLAGADPIPQRLVGQASLQGLATLGLRRAAERLKESVKRFEQKTSAVRKFLPENRIPQTGLPLEESTLGQLKLWGQELRKVTEDCRVLLDQVLVPVLSPEGFTCQRLLADLECLSRLRALEADIARESDRLMAHYGDRFAGLNTSWEEIVSALQWTRRFLDHVGSRSIPDRLLDVAAAGKAGAPEVRPLENRLDEFKACYTKLSAHFRPGHPSLNGKPLLELEFSALGARLQEILERVDSLRDWVDYTELQRQFQEKRMDSLFGGLTSIARQVTSDRVPRAVQRSLLQAWLNWAFRKDPALGRFRGEEHERLIAEFRDLDKRHCELGCHRVIREANAHRPQITVVVPGGELQILIREANKQRRHMPLRKLFGQIPNLLFQLKPCLLMSPLSVSQFLDPEKIKFDLVIFDEASQVRSEDAVGPIYRGRQLVLCGDNRQLPPTAFFEQGMSDELPDEVDDPGVYEAFGVFDSILDECAARMPQRRLEWHYRSEHESLIAFSNHLFYSDQGGLVTFPSWLEDDEGLGVKFIHLPDGVYDRGGRRDNVREAEKVVELVHEHFRRFPGQSLGVVAFSIAQADIIDNYIEKCRKQHPEMERYFTDSHLEKFFVKNLESVQGDERDVLIFSVGYGRDKYGRLTMNFGPLNLPGGERRLNVAVTRARKKVIVVSSIRAVDFDLGATTADGVRALYRYLDYAERGPVALDTQLGTGEFESPLEQNVASVIRSWGFEVVPQVGCSKFRIDLGVVDPGQPGRFILGVECDGATYHSSATARDRDRLRQQVLERLGWQIHRIWAPDWVARRETEIRRLRDAIERARTTATLRVRVGNPGSANNPSTVERPQVVERVPPETELSSPEWVVTYSVCRPNVKIPSWLEFHDSEAIPVLKQILLKVVQEEGPIHKEVAARRLARTWGLERVGGRMMESVKAAWRALQRKGEIEIRGRFLWPAQSSFRLSVRQPDIEEPESRRTIDQIPPEEIALAITMLVRDSLSIAKDKLFVTVARILGFERTGAQIQEHLEESLKSLVNTGELVAIDDRVSTP